MSDKKTKNVFSYAGIKLPINPDEESGAPSVGNYLKGGLNKRHVKQIMKCVKANKGILLEGPTGCGKTATVKWLAAVTNNKYERIQLTGSTDVDSLVGRYVLINGNTVWKDGPLAAAMRNGSWVVLDELNMALPEVLSKINGILDDDGFLSLDEKEMKVRKKKDGTVVEEIEVIHKHENFRLFATQNPWEDYAGTKELNTATLGRFRKVQLGYPKDTDEMDIISSHTGIKLTDGEYTQAGLKSVLSRLVEFAQVIRAKQASHEISSGCSTRQLISWAELLDDLTFKEAAEICILNLSSTKTDAEKIKVELDKLFKNKETLEQCIQEAEKFKDRDRKKEGKESEGEVAGADIDLDSVGIDTIKQQQLEDIYHTTSKLNPYSYKNNLT